MTAKVTPPKTKQKTDKPKEKKKKKTRYRLKLKGWLKTPADWERFNAWAKINSLPRKIPEPEPVIRTSKPLWKMRKRMDVLSKPVKKPDPSLLYRSDLGVSKKALKAKPSKRLKIIARPVIKKIAMPREFPLRVKQSALNYEASENIIKISKPKDLRTEECKKLAETLRAKEMAAGTMDEDEKKKYQKELWAVIRKAMACPNLLSQRQIRELITEGGVYRTTFDYEATPWMNFLSLPSYRFLRLRKDDDAKKFKELYLSEIETRGKQALEEQFQRAEKLRKLEEEAAANREQEETPVEPQPEASAPEPEASAPEPEAPAPEIEEQTQEDGAEALEVDGEAEVVNNNAEVKEMVEQAPEPVPEAPKIEEEKEKLDTQKIAKPKTEARPKQTRFIPRPTPLADDEESRKKRAKRNAWRFEPPPWKDGDPLKVKESALNYSGSPRMTELAKPHVHKDTVTRKKPFDVKKSALTSPVSARVTELAKPSNPREPVEKRPPRKLNKYRQPIIPIPPYGKRLPRVPRYKEKECKTADDEIPEEAEVKNKEKIETPDPIAFEPTVDPYFDPEGAQRQLNARNAIKNQKEE